MTTPLVSSFNTADVYYSFFFFVFLHYSFLSTREYSGVSAVQWTIVSPGKFEMLILYGRLLLGLKKEPTYQRAG